LKFPSDSELVKARDSMKEDFDKLSLWNAACTGHCGQQRAGLRATRWYTNWSCQKYFSWWRYEGLARFPQKYSVLKVMSLPL